MAEIRSRREIEDELDSFELPDDVVNKINKLLEDGVARDDYRLSIPLGKNGVANVKYGRAILKQLKSAGYENSCLAGTEVIVSLAKNTEYTVFPTTVSYYDPTADLMSEDDTRSMRQKLKLWLHNH